MKICPKSICDDSIQVKQNVNNKRISFQLLSFIDKEQINTNNSLFVPGYYKNFQFIPLLFEFEGIDDKIKLLVFFCKNYWKFIENGEKYLNQTKNIYESYSYWNINYLFKKIDIYKCFEYSLNIDDCVKTKKKYSYLDNHIFGFYCFEQNHSNNNKKLAKGKKKIFFVYIAYYFIENKNYRFSISTK